MATQEGNNQVSQETRESRRSILKSGVKLAYTAPLVAATFKLDARGALAATCSAGTTLVVVNGVTSCCKCRPTVLQPYRLTETSPGVWECTALNCPTVPPMCVSAVSPA